MSDYKMLIDGKLVEAKSGKTIPVLNPATKEKIAEIPMGDKTEVDAAVAAAKRAFPAWSQKPMAERAEVLRKMSAGMRARADDLVKMEVLDHGMPSQDARGWVMTAAARSDRTIAQADNLREKTINLGNQYIAYVHRAPIGVCALITPWNGALSAAIIKLGPALIMGNTCVLKPPSVDSTSTLILAEILAGIGDALPPGVINVITGPGEVTGRALASHPDVGMVSFTGSSATGKDIMAAASATVKRLCLELGGKNPFIVLEDADLDKAAQKCQTLLTKNCGQSCVSPGRVYVHEKVHDEFVAKYIAAANKVVVGDPRDQATTMGPLVSEEHHNKVESLIKSAIDEGATLALGKLNPPAPLDKGYFVPPTVLTGVTPKMRVYREEIFGPVATVIKFSDKDDVVAMANDNTYGLGASVWTRDMLKGARISRAFQACQIWVNDHSVMGPLPVGGEKESGIGKVGALEEYCEFRSVYMNIA